MAWEDLRDILAEYRAEVDAQRSTPPVACPRCGEPLRSAPRGGLHCRFDGFLHPRDRG